MGNTKTWKIRYSPIDKLYNFVVWGILLLSLAVVLFPLIHIVSASLSSPIAVISGRVTLLPVEPTLIAYEAVFNSQSLMGGFKNSFVYMGVGTVINVFMTVILAYPLSRRDFVGRNVIMFIVTFTMYFGGGLIPTYVLVASLNMTNSIWALVIPGAISAYFVIISRTFFMSTIPGELLDAAFIDGCSDIRLLWSVILPNSKAIIAVLTIMYAVGHWNSYFAAMIYIDSPSKYPLQLVLRDILVKNSMDKSMMTGLSIEDMQVRQYLSELLKYAVIVVSTVPMMVIYPFIQKHFVKGVMIGSIKG